MRWVLLALSLLAGCREPSSPWGVEASALQREDGDRGCVIPGDMTHLACSSEGRCLACWRRVTDNNLAVCVTVYVGDCP